MIRLSQALLMADALGIPVEGTPQEVQGIQDALQGRYNEIQGVLGEEYAQAWLNTKATLSRSSRAA